MHPIRNTVAQKMKLKLNFLSIFSSFQMFCLPLVIKTILWLWDEDFSPAISWWLSRLYPSSHLKTAETGILPLSTALNKEDVLDVLPSHPHSLSF